ncbi:MAG: enoyl-CoA hydratase/isomerase family protein [Spirochaetales bacterium]|nr:enoyl-CoA hydratase/isomerase family protein [Spirochaetales bacterium]
MGFIEVKTEGALARITIQREKSLNALNPELLKELEETWKTLEASGCRLALLTGSGKAFVAGADIGNMAEFSKDQALDFARAGHRVMNVIARSSVISLAAINGFALGGGLELALACHLRVAAHSARLGLPEVGLGIIPGFGGTQRLSRLIGPGGALRVILSGEMFTAAQALSMGIVEEVVEDAELERRSEEIARAILDHRSHLAQRSALTLVREGLDLPLDQALEREAVAFSELFNSDHPRTGMTAFLGKRKPEFS